MRSSPSNMRTRLAVLVGSGRGGAQAAAAAAAAVLVGVLAGAAVTFLPVWAGFAALLAVGGVALMASSTDNALAAAVGAATVAPFATLPFKAVITPSVLELLLAALLLLWVLRLLVRPDESLVLTPLGLPLVGFLGLTLFSFVLGANGSPDSLTLHNYFKFVLGVTFFFSVANCVRTRGQARWLLACLMVGGAASALAGLLLYAMPNTLAQQLLVALGPFGYPTSGRVLRFINDDTAGIERAIGLAVDPNSFGGMLALIGAIVATQAVAERPLLPRRALVAMAAAIVGALLLTYSRAALGGMVIAATYVATLRYRRLWWAILAGGALAGLLLVGLGVGEEFAARVTDGLQFRDQANQMRLAEYQNAVAVIQAYPWFGIGFGAAPEIDLTAGVSSIYLAIGQRTGLIGLGAFVAIMAAFFAQGWRALRAAGAAGDDERAAWLVCLQAGVAAALAEGLLDHYFFNIEFSHMATLFWGVVGLAVVLSGDPPEAAGAA